MHCTTRFRSRLVLAIVLVLAIPVAANAQFVTTGSFGHHGPSDLADDLVLMPIGRAECDDVIPFDFTALTIGSTERTVDVWRSSGTATCAAAASRLPPTSTCTPVPLEPGVNVRAPASSTFTMGVSARELFGSCTSGTATFWLFDATSAPDETTTFVNAPFVHIALDVDAPSAPTIPSSLYGDAEIELTWSNPPDLGEGAATFVYFDPAGCSPDDAGVAHASSNLLVAGAATPHGLLLNEAFLSSGHTTLRLSAGLFGWSAARYGEQGALAITVLDSAYNESVLSNVVCVAHLPTTTVEAGTMPDAAAGDGRYLIRACSIGGRPQPLALLPILGALVLARHRRLSGAALRLRRPGSRT